MMQHKLDLRNREQRKKQRSNRPKKVYVCNGNSRFGSVDKRKIFHKKNILVFQDVFFVPSPEARGVFVFPKRGNEDV